MPKRQFVIMYDPAWDAKDHTAAQISGEGGGPPPNPEPMGTRKEILRSLKDYNTWPDVEGGEFLYGPGITIQLPPTDERTELTQLIVALVEENIAWPVLTRICKGLHWLLVDLDSGRTLSFADSSMAGGSQEDDE